MNSRRLEITVGAFVLLGLIAVTYLALKIGAGTLTGAKTYLLHARFANAAGVNAGTNVVIAGVTVGRVESMTVDPKSFWAIVDVDLRQDIQIPADSKLMVRSAGLIGDKFLAIEAGSDSKNLAAGDTFAETDSTVDLESLISRFAFGSVQNKDTQDKKDTP